MPISENVVTLGSESVDPSGEYLKGFIFAAIAASIPGGLSSTTAHASGRHPIASQAWRKRPGSGFHAPTS